MVEDRRRLGGWLPVGCEGGAVGVGAEVLAGGSANLTRRWGAALGSRGWEGPASAPTGPGGAPLSSTDLSSFSSRFMTSGVIPSCDPQDQLNFITLRG